MEKLQIDKKVTKQLRIDLGMHKLLKVRASTEGKSLKEFAEGIFSDYLYVAD